MPNNFRRTGTAYISKAGHDSNDGLTKDTPKKTVGSQLTGKKAIIGSGYYYVSGDFLPQSNGNFIFGDGAVILDCNNTIIVTGAISIIDRVYYVTIQKASSLNIRNTAFYNCVIIDIASLTFNVTTMEIVNSIFINVAAINGINRYADKSIFINFKGSFYVTSIAPGAIASLQNSYFDISSSITAIEGPGTKLFIKYCNIQGFIVIGGLKYVIKDQFTGTPQDAGYASDVYWLTEANLTANGYTGTITGWDAAVATCINRDPKFNDASKLDFTLKADSPHIGRAFDGVSNIGGTAYAQSFYAGSSNPNLLLLQSSANIDTSNNNDWKLLPGEIEGTIRAIVKVANTTEAITKLPYIGNKSFNSDGLGGSSTNFNVPDSKPVTSAYPDYRTTTGAASDLFRVVVAGHGYMAGVWLKVDGQYREVTSVTADELIFNDAVRGIVGASTPVQVGTLSALTSLNPNRLNYLMRSSLRDNVDSSNWDDPLTWDNNGLADSGQYLAQEWDNQPLIDNLNNVGFGDDNFDPNFGNPIQVKYIDIMIYLRNNYRS